MCIGFCEHAINSEKNGILLCNVGTVITVHLARNVILLRMKKKLIMLRIKICNCLGERQTLKVNLLSKFNQAEIIRFTGYY